VAVEQKLSSKLLSELTQELENRIYLLPNAATWAIESWIKALEIPLAETADSKPNSTSDSEPTDLDKEETIYLTSAQMQYGAIHRLVINQEAINVTIPPKTKINTRLRLKGKGKLDSNSQQRGNLYLRIEELEIEPETTKDNEFDTTPVSLDIEGSIFLTEAEMLNGVQKHIIRENRDYNVKIPSGTKVGTRIRLKGQGLVNRRTQQKGDLYLLVKRKSVQSSETSTELIYDGINYTKLRDLLKNCSWKRANEETGKLLLEMLEMTRRQNFDYLPKSTIQKLPCNHLEKIDFLWKTASNDSFGFKVQHQIWQEAGQKWGLYCEWVKWKKKKLFSSWCTEDDLVFFPTDAVNIRGHLPAWFLWTGSDARTFMKKLNQCFGQK
jgi:curved DNA-binding protein CbpA